MKVAFEIDGFGADENLKGGGLRVEKLCATGKHFLLRSVIRRGERSVGTDDIEDGHRMCTLPSTESSDTRLERREIEAGLHGRTHLGHRQYTLRPSRG